MLVRPLVTLAAFGSIVDAFAPRSGTIVHRRIASGVSSSNEVMVIMNGLSGAMGNEVASACLRRGMRLAPVALSGPSSGGTTVEVGGVKVSLVDGSDATKSDEAAATAKQSAVAAGCKRLICIDYTHPSAVKANAEW